VLGVEGVESLAAELGLPVPDPLLARRSVVLRGAEVEALRGRAGIRCAALTDGVLRLGPAGLRSAVPLPAERAGEAHRLRP
jgi:hypothetical protein